MVVKIIDNYLEASEHHNIEELMASLTSCTNFPWVIGTILDEKDLKCDPDNNVQLCHTFYDFGRPISEVPILDPFIKKLDPFALRRIKANCNLKTKEIVEHGYHVDFLHKNLTTAVYYVNSNNGYTKFEDGTKVDSVANRLAIFPSTMFHSGSTCTDKDMRVVINFNYFPNLDETPELKHEVPDEYAAY